MKRLVGLVLVASVALGGTAHAGDPYTAAECANDIATVLDYEAEYLDDLALAYAESMDYKCLTVGAKVEARRDRLFSRGYSWAEMLDGPLIRYAVRRVARAYGVSRAELLTAFGDLYGTAA